MHTVSGNASSPNMMQVQIFFLTFISLIILNKEGNGTQFNAIFGGIFDTHTHTNTQEAESKVKLIY